QAKLHHLGIALAGSATADHEAAMRHVGVVTLEGFFINEMDRGVVVSKVIGHGNDCLLYHCGVRPLFKHHETLTLVLFAGRKRWPLAVPDALDSFGHRHGILNAGLYARPATYGARMPRAQAFAPERISGAVGQHGFSEQTVQ